MTRNSKSGTPVGLPDSRTAYVQMRVSNKADLDTKATYVMKLASLYTICKYINVRGIFIAFQNIILLPLTHYLITRLRKIFCQYTYFPFLHILVNDFKKLLNFNTSTLRLLLQLS